MKELLGWYGYDQAVPSPDGAKQPAGTLTDIASDLDSVCSSGTTPDSVRARTPEPTRCVSSPYAAEEGNNRPASAPGASKCDTMTLY